MRDEGGTFGELIPQAWLESTLWSALTCQRFGRSRPVAAMVRRNPGKDHGAKSPKAKAVPGHRTPKRGFLLILAVAVMGFACAANQERRSIPPEVESAISSINEEIAAERYDKIYNEASELWRQDNTLEESIASFKTLRTKLGSVESRVLQSATEQQNSGGSLKGRAYIVTYRTKFQNGEGMETFTLVERDGRWLLARYFVNSTALK
jgi:hypothetical protein